MMPLPAITPPIHNPQRRAQVAAHNAGYNHPPHPSFFLGHGMTPPVQYPIVTH